MKKNKLVIPGLLLILLAIIVFNLLHNRLLNFGSKPGSEAGFYQNTPIPSLTIPFSTKGATITKNLLNLEKIINNSMENSQGNYGIVVKNLQTQEEYYLNEHRVFEPASLYKLWVMATAFKQIEAGILYEDTKLSQDLNVLYGKFKISTKGADLSKGRITLTVSDALEAMIENSDNHAALLLSEKVRHSNIQIFLQDNGFNDSFLGVPPRTTPYDIGIFLEKLYQEKLAGKESTQKMMALLKKQTINHKLPKYLPENTVIAHKTGELGFFTHDAGIVFSDKGDYIIVIMSESDNPNKAQEYIARVSKAVYDYFTIK